MIVLCLLFEEKIMSHSYCRKCGKEILSVENIANAYCESCKREYEIID